MNKKNDKELEEFICEKKRLEEEDFSKTFSQNPNVELFFILENNSYTDGKNIVLDPHIFNLYKDDAAWIKTIKFMEGVKFKLNFMNRYLTLSWITRALNIHESSHIRYTNFPSISTKVNKGKKYKMILATVSNIIEDSFIDHKAIEEYSNAYTYMFVFRILTMMRSHFFEASTIDDNLKDVVIDENGKDKIKDILEFYSSKYVYYMFDIEKPEYLKEELEFLDPIFDMACKSGNPDLRDELSIKITDYLYNEVLDNKNDEDKESIEDLKEKLKELLVDFDVGTDGFNYAKDERKGEKTSDVGEKIELEDLAKILNASLDETLEALNELMKEIEIQRELENGNTFVYNPGSISDNLVHSEISLYEVEPPVNTKLESAYNNIKNQYKININSFNRQFTKLLKEKHEVYGDKKIIGPKLSSKNFSDPKERFWCIKDEEVTVPDVGILFMLDGSGSMEDIIDDAKESLIIVHETLKKFEIKHSIVLHKAIYEQPKVEHDILLPFDSKRGQEYNILLPVDLENTREGLSLLWTIKYLKKINTEHKIIVMISDGLPVHDTGDYEYCPPVSVYDAREARIKLESLGYTVIAIALHGCYESLIEIYDKVIDCKDITKLTGKLLQFISSEIEKY